MPARIYLRDEQGRLPWEAAGLPRSTWQHRTNNGQTPLADFVAQVSPHPVDEFGRKPWEVEGISQRAWNRRKRGCRPREEFLAYARAFGADGRDLDTYGSRSRQRGWSTAVIDAFGAKHHLTWSTLSKAKRQVEDLLGYDVPRSFERGSDAETSFLMDFENIVLPVLSRNPAEVKPVEVLTASGQARLDAAIRRHQRELDRAWDEKLAKAAGEYAQAHLLPYWVEKIRMAEEVMTAERQKALGFVTKAEYRQLLAFFHPDSNFSEGAYNAAFNLFKGLEKALVKPEPKVLTGSQPPRTLSEILAMKLARDEELRRQRAAAKAKRNA